MIVLLPYYLYGGYDGMRFYQNIHAIFTSLKTDVLYIYIYTVPFIVNP